MSVCKRCGKDTIWTHYTMSVEVTEPIHGYRHYNLCGDCYREWIELLRDRADEFLKNEEPSPFADGPYGDFFE